MRWDTKEPCKSCPYRRDAPLGFWHPEEFDKLVDSERSQMGSVFACHGTKSNMSVCAGWLLKQRDNGIPSIVLRLQLMRNQEAVDCLNQVSDGGHELYDSVDEMIDANEALGRCDSCERYLGEDGECKACVPVRRKPRKRRAR